MRWRAALALAAIAPAGIVYLAIVYAYPRVAMHAAMDKIGRHGQRVNSWIHAQRATAAARTIVRPSPDIAYSICILDLARGPVSIHAAPWSGYWSLSLYAADSDNVHTWSDREAAQGVDILVTGPSDGAAGEARIAMPSTTGIAVIRRLAPSALDWERVATARREDRCQRES